MLGSYNVLFFTIVSHGPYRSGISSCNHTRRGAPRLPRSSHRTTYRLWCATNDVGWSSFRSCPPSPSNPHGHDLHQPRGHARSALSRGGGNDELLLRMDGLIAFPPRCDTIHRLATFRETVRDTNGIEDFCVTLVYAIAMQHIRLSLRRRPPPPQNDLPAQISTSSHRRRRHASAPPNLRAVPNVSRDITQPPPEG